MIACLLLAAFAAAPPTPGAGPQPAIPPPPAFQAPVPEVTTTPAGLRMVVLERHEVPLVHLAVVIKAGASLDPADKPGLAAAVAAMLQEGGAGERSGPALAEAFEALGTVLEISPDRDGVFVGLTVMTRHLDAALGLLVDLLARPRFDGAEWPRFRDRRAAEIVRRLDEPRYVAETTFDRTVFGGHPYGAPVLGTEASVRALAVEDLKSFYAKNYGPKTTSVIAVGDLARAKALEMVGKSFGPWTSLAVPAAPPAPAPAALARMVLVDRPGAPQSELRVGHPGLARSSPDFAAATAVQTVLGGSFTSRLVQNLREKHGYTYGVRSSFAMLDAPGPFLIRTSVRSDVTAAALKEILSELEGIRVPMPEAELRKARALQIQELVQGFSEGHDAVQLIGDLVMHGMPLDAWSKHPAQLEALEPKGLSAIAQRLVRPDGLTIVVVGDRKAIESSLRELPAGKKLDVVGDVVQPRGSTGTADGGRSSAP